MVKIEKSIGLVNGRVGVTGLKPDPGFYWIAKGPPVVAMELNEIKYSYFVTFVTTTTV